MSADIETGGSFILSYNHPDGDSYRFAFNEPLTWHEALTKMVSFLGSIYGYDLTNYIAIKQNNFAINRDSWNGPTFGGDNEDTSVGLSD